MKISIAVLCLALAGCTGVETIYVPLEPIPNYIQVTEVRPSWFSTHTVGVVYDEDGKIVGVTGSGGRAVIDIPLSVLGASATVTGAVILGRGIEGAAKGMQLDAGVTHRVELPELPELPEAEIP